MAYLFSLGHWIDPRVANAAANQFESNCLVAGSAPKRRQTIDYCHIATSGGPCRTRGKSSIHLFPILALVRLKIEAFVSE